MHKIRGQARREAWKPDSMNPFAKGNAFRFRSNDEEQATRMRTNRSENNMTPTIEQRRLSQRFENQGPHHANTMPSSAGSQNTNKDAVVESNAAGSSESSGNTTSDTVDASARSDHSSYQGTKPRRRRTGILGVLSGHKKDKEPPQRPGLEQHHRKSSEFFKKDKQKFTFSSQIRATLLNSWINVLLVFVPVGIAVHYAHITPVGDFVINFVAIIPLAAMLSYATEEIALRVGETLGGLLNATFGNAVELIVSILALTKNEVDIVQESLIGSMLSNLLLVLGMSFLLGGATRVRQHFNMTVAQTASSLLALAVGSLIIPAAFRDWAEGESERDKSSDVTALSRGTALLLLVVYGCYLFFQLKTHIEIYNAPSKKVEKRSKMKEKKAGDAKANLIKGGDILADPQGPVAKSTEQPKLQIPADVPEEKAAQIADEAEDDDDAEVPQLSKVTALLTLAISTALVAICAEGMVGSIDAITAGCSVSRTFVGLILLPIVGNAAEHATAVTVATKDKMDLSIGVAVGSSMQIALLVIPFMVILGWIIGNEEMNLAFDGFQIIVLFVSILLVNYLIQDGESHWLEGVLLCILYLIIAIAAWYYPEADGKCK